MTDQEKAARECLADEVAKMNRPLTAAAIRDGGSGDYMEAAAIRAMIAFANQSDQRQEVERRAYRMAYAPLRSAQHALDLIARPSSTTRGLKELAREESERIGQAIAAWNTRPAQPETDVLRDWVMVPRVPTEAMLQAAMGTRGMKAVNDCMHMHQARGNRFDEGDFEPAPLNQAWSAMLSAVSPVGEG